MLIRTLVIRPHERGLLFRDGAFQRLLAPGRHWLAGWKLRVDRVSVRETALRHPDLDVIVRAGVLEGQALVLDLADHERALVWVDGRLEAILRPGLHVYWTVFRTVRHERVDARELIVQRSDLPVLLGLPASGLAIESVRVEAGHVGLLFRDGRHAATFEPGLFAVWKGVGAARLVAVDVRERVLDVAGQEIMTADKVTLRLNALVTFRVTDPLKAYTAVEDHNQALYRETQLALRAVVGAKDLDALLGEKDVVARELDGEIRRRSASFGLEIVAVGIRDLILPGEMRTLMNRVTEARKAAEANLIVRREETAAMRSQANTAKIFETNPMLMKLRELEVLEKVAEKAQLKVILGETGLSDRLVKLI